MRTLSVLLVLSLTACAPSTAAWLSVDAAHAKPKKAKKGAADAAQPITVGFGWKAGWKGTYRISQVTERITTGAPTKVESAKGTGAIDVRSRDGALGVNWDTVTFELPTTTLDGVPEPDAMPPAVSAFLQKVTELPYEMRIGTDGALQGLMAQEATGASYDDLVDNLFASFVADADEADRPMLQAVFTQLKPMLGSDKLLADAQQTWNGLVTTWLSDDPYTVGMGWDLTWSETLADGTDLAFTGNLSLLALEPCHAGKKAPTCGRLVLTTVPDPAVFGEQIRAATQAQMDAAGAEVKVDVSAAQKNNEVVVLTELDTLRPWSYTLTESSSYTMAVGEDTQDGAVTKTTTYTFDW